MWRMTRDIYQIRHHNGPWAHLSKAHPNQAKEVPRNKVPLLYPILFCVHLDP